ncbi:MAG: Bacterial domain [Microbacteriaceae bacterium]|nr:Bacterial domain [Microbacteriaceae bacterium]
MASPDKHLVKLQEILQPGEAVLGHVAGTITTTPTSTSGTVRGSLVITDRRILFSGGSWGATDSRSLPLSNVTSIDLHKNLMLAYVQVAHARRL